MHARSRLVYLWYVLPLLWAVPNVHGQTAEQLRGLIHDRVGGIEKLIVPANDDEMPQPDDPRFHITPERKRLGKLLFFDPVRNNDIRPEFGGVRALTQTTSCGSCHLGETASKAGQVMNFGQGAEGRGFIDPISGDFVARRTALPELEDVIPTQNETFDLVGNLVLSGRFDAVDSVPRVSPSVIGFAFNQRLLWDGAAGEPYDPTDPDKANANPKNLPAGESIAERAFRAHRMLDTQRFVVQQLPVYMELFRDAYPEDYAIYEASGNPDDLCNNDTVQRAVAAFLRSVVTRHTPWDHFLAGDDSALSDQQIRGAHLFFSSIESGGANCVACHSGPNLNKVAGDESGLLVEENFHNVGIGDHPLQDLLRSALNNPDHRDKGRSAVTADPADDFKFKTPTLRQMRDAAPFMHNGAFTSLRGVVSYFNDGVPESDERTATLSPLFAHPRGAEVAGLGLSDDDVDAIVAFLDGGLYDPAFVEYDPNSTTETFELNVRDLTYSARLRALGAVNGRVPSLLQHPQTDALSVADLKAEGVIVEPAPTALCGAIGAPGIAMLTIPLMSLRYARRRRPSRPGQPRNTTC